jgi:hypothetical protein
MSPESHFEVSQNMSDMNTFIDAVAKDVDTLVVPKVENLAAGIGAKAEQDYVPRVSTFAHQLVQDIVTEQTVVIRDFVTGIIKDLSQRYKPEFTGQLRTRIVSGGVQISGENVSLNLKRRDNGATVSTLDIPISLTIKVDDLAVNVQDATITLDVVR